MEQRVTLITLGVSDVAASRNFYERLGWRVAMDVEETVFFQAGDLVLTLWSRAKLSADSGVEDGGGWGGVTLAHNVASLDEVHRVMEEARAAGARISREPDETFYGGYAGAFVDPDGHSWEVAHNPAFELTPEGVLRLPTP